MRFFLYKNRYPIWFIFFYRRKVSNRSKNHHHRNSTSPCCNDHNLKNTDLLTLDEINRNVHSLRHGFEHLSMLQQQQQQVLMATQQPAPPAVPYPPIYYQHHQPAQQPQQPQFVVQPQLISPAVINVANRATWNDQLVGSELIGFSLIDQNDPQSNRSLSNDLVNSSVQNVDVQVLSQINDVQPKVSLNFGPSRLGTKQVCRCVCVNFYIMCVCVRVLLSDFSSL